LNSPDVPGQQQGKDTDRHKRGHAQQQEMGYLHLSRHEHHDRGHVASDQCDTGGS